MNDKVTIYYYTAWDGFAWQGCDEATAKSLQGYLEATRTLPKSSVEKPPFGGAVPCKIAGEVGVAVYRYMTREKGDLAGRDSLYIALAFIPLKTGCVDFAKLLGLRQLSVPKPGGLRPEEISVSALGLRMTNSEEEPGDWLDGDIAETNYRVLNGREGLHRLAALFFSKYTQLGFLNAVFRADSGIDDLVSTQTYKIYPEVAEVAAASAALREARKTRGGVIGRNHEVVRRMEAALDKLYGWCEKQRSYKGLKEYYDVKKQEMCDDADRIALIKERTNQLNKALETARGEKVTRDASANNVVREHLDECARLAGEVLSIPVLDHESYREALKVTVRALRYSAETMGLIDGLERAFKAEERQKEAEARLEREIYEHGNERREAEGIIASLRADLAKKESELKKFKAGAPVSKDETTKEKESGMPLAEEAEANDEVVSEDIEAATVQVEAPHTPLHKLPLPITMKRKGGNGSFSLLTWSIAIATVILVVLLGVVAFYALRSTKGGDVTPSDVATTPMVEPAPNFVDQGGGEKAEEPQAAPLSPMEPPTNPEPSAPHETQAHTEPPASPEPPANPEPPASPEPQANPEPPANPEPQTNPELPDAPEPPANPEPQVNPNPPEKPEEPSSQEPPSPPNQSVAPAPQEHPGEVKAQQRNSHKSAKEGRAVAAHQQRAGGSNGKLAKAEAPAAKETPAPSATPEGVGGK